MAKLTREYLRTLSPEDRRKEITEEYIKCALDGIYCIENYFTVEAQGKRVPFILFPHQVRTFNAYENFQSVLSMKTRQMGFTTFTAAWVAWNMMTKNNFKTLLISKTMLDAKKFLKEIKDLIKRVVEDYPWLCRGFDPENNNKESFTLLGTNSYALTQSTTEDAGRGMSAISALIIDEVSTIDRRSPNKMSEIVAAAGVALTTARGKFIGISTPKGQSGWYYETYVNAAKKGFKIVNAPWKDHPKFNLGMYQWIPDKEDKEKGELKMFDVDWPSTIYDQDNGQYIKLNKEDYPFIKDGKLRSPWYDFESTRLGPQLTKCELDCSFMGTGGEVLESELIKELQDFIDESPIREGMTLPFAMINGLFKSYKEYIGPISGHRYVLAADVATGDGSDYSGFVVIDIDTLEVVATFKEQLLPEFYATLISMVGRRYFNAIAVVENAGGGGTTLNSLKDESYPNIYYTLLQAKDPTTNLRRKKLGLLPSEAARQMAGDRLEQVLRNRSLKFYCPDIMAELYTWIWDKDGKRRHAPGKHDDLIMALQWGIYYILNVIKKNDRLRRTFKQIAEVKTANMSGLELVKKVAKSTEQKGLISEESNTSVLIYKEMMKNMKPYENYKGNVSYGNIDKMTGDEFIQKKGW